MFAYQYITVILNEIMLTRSNAIRIISKIDRHSDKQPKPSRTANLKKDSQSLLQAEKDLYMQAFYGAVSIG